MLTVEVTVDADVARPGTTTGFTVTLRDPAGNPVAGEVAGAFALSTLPPRMQCRFSVRLAANLPPIRSLRGGRGLPGPEASPNGRPHIEVRRQHAGLVAVRVEEFSRRHQLHRWVPGDEAASREPPGAGAVRGSEPRPVLAAQSDRQRRRGGEIPAIRHEFSILFCYRFLSTDSISWIFQDIHHYVDSLSSYITKQGCTYCSNDQAAPNQNTNYGGMEDRFTDSAESDGGGGGGRMEMASMAPAPPPSMAPSSANRGNSNGASAAAAAPAAAAGPSIPVRSAFETAPLFEPTLSVPASGSLHVAFPLPDNVGAFKIRVYAVTSTNRFGAGEAEQVTRDRHMSQDLFDCIKFSGLMGSRGSFRLSATRSASNPVCRASCGSVTPSSVVRGLPPALHELYRLSANRVNFSRRRVFDRFHDLGLRPGIRRDGDDLCNN